MTNDKIKAAIAESETKKKQSRYHMLADILRLRKNKPMSFGEIATSRRVTVRTVKRWVKEAEENEGIRVMVLNTAGLYQEARTFGGGGDEEMYERLPDFIYERRDALLAMYREGQKDGNR